VFGVDLGLRNSAVIITSRQNLWNTEDYSTKTCYWKWIDRLKSKLPKRQESFKRIRQIWWKIARITILQHMILQQK